MSDDCRLAHELEDKPSGLSGYVDGEVSTQGAGTAAIEEAHRTSHANAMALARIRLEAFLEQPDSPVAIDDIEAAIRGVRMSYWTMRPREIRP